MPLLRHLDVAMLDLFLPPRDLLGSSTINGVQGLAGVLRAHHREDPAPGQGNWVGLRKRLRWAGKERRNEATEEVHLRRPFLWHSHMCNDDCRCASSSDTHEDARNHEGPE